MSAVNFKHLRYFWAVAKAGSIARAGEQLHVTPQSISAQLKELEEALGNALLQRAGRGLAITEAGRRVLDCAEEIFALEEALVAAARADGAGAPLPFRIGVADSVPKSLAYRVVEPALRLTPAVRLVAREGRLVALLTELAVNRLDMVIADRPMPGEVKVRAYNHLLGASDLTVFGVPAQAAALRRRFPRALDGAPFLLPGEGVAIRPALEQWLAAQGVRPRVVGEFDDSALMKAFGAGGGGLFVAPTAIADDVCRQYGVRAIGRIPDVVEHLFAITPERRLRHPAVVAISEAAAQHVFGPGSDRDARGGARVRATMRA